MTTRRVHLSLKTLAGESTVRTPEACRAMPRGSRGLLRDVRELILGVRFQVAHSVDTSLTMLYWQVGCRIRGETLKGTRAKYGEKVVVAVATRLEIEFGRGFGEKNLRRMVQFAEQFPDKQIVAALLRQLGW